MVRIAVTARKYKYEELKKELKTNEKIVILSCESCAKLSDGLGGAIGAANLAEKLTGNGFHVTHRQLINSACSPDQLKESVREEEITLKEAADRLGLYHGGF